jgi:hypothetical protein
MRVFEAANGLDAPVGFVTDKMIKEGRLGGLKLIVVPSARHVEADVLHGLARFAESGGRILLVGDALMYDEYRREIAAPRSPGFSRIALGPTARLSQDLDGAFSSAGVSRPLRLTTDGGGSAWPIEFRCVDHADGKLCYIIGLNKQPAMAAIAGQGAGRGWTDLMTGEKGSSPRFNVKPLDTRLLLFR